MQFSFPLQYSMLYVGFLTFAKAFEFAEQHFGHKFIQYPAAEISKFTQMFLFSQPLAVTMCGLIQCQLFLPAWKYLFHRVAPSHSSLLNQTLSMKIAKLHLHSKSNFGLDAGCVQT